MGLLANTAKIAVLLRFRGTLVRWLLGCLLTSRVLLSCGFLDLSGALVDFAHGDSLSVEWQPKISLIGMPGGLALRGLAAGTIRNSLDHWHDSL
jgi:hypothetical protein